MGLSLARTTISGFALHLFVPVGCYVGNTTAKAPLLTAGALLLFLGTAVRAQLQRRGRGAKVAALMPVVS